MSEKQKYEAVDGDIDCTDYIRLDTGRDIGIEETAEIMNAQFAELSQLRSELERVQSKLTASESARVALVAEVMAWRAEFTHEGVMDDNIGLAMLAVDSLKLLEGGG